MDIESLFSDTPQIEAEEPTPEIVVTEEPVIEVAAEPVIETPEPQPDPVQEVREDKSVPLPTFLDIRDRLKDAERERDELRRQQAQPANVPDPLDDPNGFAQYQNNYLEQRLFQERFMTSDLYAKEKFGAEAVEAAGNWAVEQAKADPSFEARYRSQPDPMGWIVRQHKRDGLLSQIGDKDLDTFVKDYALANPDKFGLTAPVAAAIPVAVTQQAPKPVAPRPSLASAPASGGGVKDVPTGPMAALEAVFKG